MRNGVERIRWAAVFFIGLLLTQSPAARSQEALSPASNVGIPAEVSSQKTTDNSLHEDGRNENHPDKEEPQGFEFELGFTSEVFGKLRGGLDSHRRGEYLGSIEATVNISLSKARIGRGQVFVGTQNLHGRGVNDSMVGALQTASNLDAEAFTRLTELWYSDEYLHGRIRTKLGRQYADSDFGSVENGSDFLNASYGAIPTNPMPAYPFPGFGASIWLDPLTWISLGAGVFREGLSKHPDPGSHNIRQGPYALMEIKLEPIPGRAGHHGIFRMGAWQQSHGAWMTQTEGSSISRAAQNYGIYAAADYWFHQPSEEEDGGAGLFFQWGWAPADRNEVQSYMGGGIVYKGLFRQRPKDVLGLGTAQARFSNAVRETAIEMFYKWQASAHMSIQPDLQWEIRPGGTGPNALLFGLRAEYRF